jgi:hypothetical protein
MPVENAIEGTTTLEASGETVKVTDSSSTRLGGLAILNHRLGDATSTLSPERLGQASEPVDCLIVTAGSESVLSVTASRFRADTAEPGNGKPTENATASTWLVDPSVPLTADFHGACVVSRANGKVVGLLTVSDDANRVALISNRQSSPASNSCSPE